DYCICIIIMLFFFVFFLLYCFIFLFFFFFFQAEDGIRDKLVTGVQTCALPIWDISAALNQHPELYTLSLGHMGDLTLPSFAYLRLPLFIAGVAVLMGAIGIARCWPNQRRCFFVMAAGMILFFHAARLAMIVFDPYLGSKPLADALTNAPPGKLIEADAYYAFSSILFYTNRQALL